jgi:integrase
VPPAIKVEPPKPALPAQAALESADPCARDEQRLARLALELLLNTGQRKGDVIRLGRQHMRDGVITLTQNKTGAVVNIPVHSDLQAALDAIPPRQGKSGETVPLTFLRTTTGRAYGSTMFGRWFRDQCVAAGVEFRAHGLRKPRMSRGTALE